MRGHGRDFLRARLTGILVTFLGMLTPQATAVIVDPAVPDADRGMLLLLGAALLAAACGQGLCQLAQGYTVSLRQEVKARAAMQAAMWDRLLHVQPAFFRQYATGDLLARVMAITLLSQKVVSRNHSAHHLEAAAWRCSTWACWCTIRPPLSLVAMGITLVASVVTLAAGVRTVRALQPLQVLEGTIFGLMVQLLHGVTKLRVAGAEQRAFAYWRMYFQAATRAAPAGCRPIQDGIDRSQYHAPQRWPPVVLFWWATRLFAPT